MPLGATFLALGALAISLAWLGWRHRNEDRISAIELAILKMSGSKPTPRTDADRDLNRGALIVLGGAGLVFALVGLFLLLGD